MTYQKKYKPALWVQASGRPQAVKSPKPIRKVSTAMAKKLHVYRVKKAAFMVANPICQVKGCPVKATQLHHKAGRLGGNLLDDSTWMAVCAFHHTDIHSNPSWAYRMGYLLRRNL